MKEVSLVLWIVVGGFGHLFSQKMNPTDPVGRIAPILKSRQVVSEVMVQVSDSTAFVSWLRKSHPDLIVRYADSKFFSISNFNKNSLQVLQHAPGVKFIDRADRKASEETVLGDFDLTLNKVTTAHTLFPSLTGDGLTVSIKEKPFDQEDIDLRGRIILNDQFDEPSTLHATFMATLAAGSGNTSPSGQGVAWGASITTSDFAKLLPDDPASLSGVSVQNHSYGVGVENYYGIESAAYDASCNSFPKLLHIFSSGNEGNKSTTEGMYANLPNVANLTGQFKVSKNTMAVGSSDRSGNVVNRSSRGPAHDGRIKPELIAFGDAGSSESAAVVSGIALLLQQSYKNKYSVLPDAALIKAALINSADDAGRPQVDFETGYGNADALGAIRMIESENFKSGSVAQDEQNIFTINVPANIELLKVTLAWTDPPAEPFAAQALVNDLDLSVRHITSGDTWNPWTLNSSPSVAALQEVAQRGIDRINTVEQVTLPFPAEGSYEINVRGHSISEGEQSFFVAYETVSGFEWVYPVEKNSLHSKSTIHIRWQWYDQPAEGLLEYKRSTENTWSPISAVELDQSYYEWLTPDEAGLFQLRMTTPAEVFESSVFSLSNPERLQVGYHCDDEIMFLWNATSSADGYHLYTLGEKYLEPVLITTDTFAIIPKSVSLNFYSVVPFFEDIPGAREFTIDYNLQGVGCYFRSFIPRQTIVTEEAIFDVSLGTSHNLLSATLERSANDSFEPVQTISPVDNKDMTFTDPFPIPGSHLYRIRLITKNQESIFSSEEKILYVPEDVLIVYPNPVSIGEDINVIVSDEEMARIDLFDVNGNLVKQATDLGTVKAIETTLLAKGIYLLRVYRQNGNVLTGKVFVF